jgi:hypothetical protein
MKQKIMCVDAYDGNFKLVDIEFENRNVIILSLSSKLNEPLFREVINNHLPPQTDGDRVYWQNGASLSLDEITAMLRADNSDKKIPQKKPGLIFTIGGAVAILLSGVLVVVGLLDAVERSRYQNMAMNTPVVIVLALVFLAGVVALVLGLKKMKSTK